MVNFRSRPSDVGSDWIRRTNAEWRRRNQQQRAAAQRVSRRQHMALFMSGMAGAEALSMMPLYFDGLAELERRGVASAAITLAQSARHDGTGLPLKPEEQTAFVSCETDARTVCVTRREADSRLARQSGRELLWIKLEAGVAVLMAIVAAFS